MKEQLRQRLIDSGWRDQLKEYTMGAPQPREATLARAAHLSPAPLPPTPPSSGLRARARADLIRNKGDAHLTVEQLTKEITPQGRGAHPHRPRARAPPPRAPSSRLTRVTSRHAVTVPDDIKMELLANIRKFVEDQS